MSKSDPGWRSDGASGNVSSVSGGLNRTVIVLYDWGAGGLFEVF
jgi:hypothetical protein